MGTRSRTFIAIAASASPDLKAPWIGQIGATVTTDSRGTLLVFEENLAPLWSRFDLLPGPVKTFDLELERQMYEWLGTIGAARFRFVRGDERLEPAGRLDVHPWASDADVRELEHQVLVAFGPEYTSMRAADYALGLTFEQFQRTGRDVADLGKLPGVGATDFLQGAAWPGRVYGGTPDLEASLQLFATGPNWQLDPDGGEERDLEAAEHALYGEYHRVLREHAANAKAAEPAG